MVEVDIVQLKFSFPIPSNKWISNFSKTFTDLQFEMLSMLLLSKNTGSGLFQIKGKKSNLAKFWEESSQFYAVEKYTLIFQDQHSILVNILFDNPWVIQTLMEAQQFIIQYPILIRRGTVSIDLIAPRNKIDLIFTNPDWKAVDISVKKIKQYCPDSLLSPRQSDILNLALDNGYFDIPRKKSLSELAEDLHISPTALSENLRRINKKLANNYLNYCDE